MMIKYIIFDFDGTIVNSRSLAIQLYNELAEKNAYGKIEEQEIDYLSKLAIKDRLRALRVPFHKLPGLVLEIKSNYQKSLGSLKVKDGIPVLLQDLKENGYKLCIISSNSVTIIQTFLEQNGISNFDHIYCTRNLFGKSVMMNRFLKKHHIQKQHVVYMGDEFRDIAACNKSDIRMIAVTWGYDSEELLLKGKPNFMIHHPADLLSLLEDIKRGGGNSSWPSSS